MGFIEGMTGNSNIDTSIVRQATENFKRAEQNLQRELRNERNSNLRKDEDIDSLRIRLKTTSEGYVEQRDKANEQTHKLSQLAQALLATETERDYAQAGLVASRYAYHDALKYLNVLKDAGAKVDLKLLDGEDKSLMDVIRYEYLFSKGYAVNDPLDAAVESVSPADWTRFVHEIRLDIGQNDLDGQWVDQSGFSTNYMPRYQRNAIQNKMTIDKGVEAGHHYTSSGMLGEHNYKERPRLNSGRKK